MITLFISIIILLFIISSIIIYLLIRKINRIDADQAAWFRQQHRNELDNLDQELAKLRKEKTEQIMVESASLAAELARKRNSEIEEAARRREEELREDYFRLKQVLNDNYEQACITNQNLIEESELRANEAKKRLTDTIAEIESRRNEAERNLNQVQDTLEKNQRSVKETINQLNKQAADLQAQYETNLTLATEKMEAEILAIHTARMAQIDRQVEETYKTRLAAIEVSLTEANEAAESAKKEMTKVISALQSEIDDYKKKQAAINQEIIRRREVEENVDFYRIILDPAAHADIQILCDIRGKLIFREKLDKLIYDNYIDKPAKEMIKRVLRGKDPSGIYKITRLKTGEIYVGKSSGVATRWLNHIKTVFGVGSVAHSMLHTTVQKDGIENFTFELLEEVSKDKLTEREKYWIDFFDSKNYGMNERNG